MISYLIFFNMVQLCAIKFWIVRLSPNKLANPTTTLPFFEWLVLFKCFFIYRRFRIYCHLTGWLHHNSTNKNLPYIILYRYEFDIGDNSSYENVFSNLIKWLAIIFSSKNIAFHHFYFLMNAWMNGYVGTKWPVNCPNQSNNDIAFFMCKHFLTD